MKFQTVINTHKRKKSKGKKKKRNKGMQTMLVCMHQPVLATSEILGLQIKSHKVRLQHRGK